MAETIQLLVSGNVHGVGYRWWTTMTAVRLELAGWVRNLRDGRVEIVARGGADALRALEQACHEGPSSASVNEVLRRGLPDDPSLEGFGMSATAAAPRDVP